MAHRAVLACCSPYLFEIFNSDIEPHGVSHVTFEDLDPEAVEILLNYAYTAQLVTFMAFDLLQCFTQKLLKMIDNLLFCFVCVTQAKGRQGTCQGSLLCSQKVQDGASQTGLFSVICLHLIPLRNPGRPPEEY